MRDVTPDRYGRLEAAGQRVYWERFGPGGRDTVVLLNGLAMQTRAWHWALPELLPYADVLLFDYPGQGESSDPAGEVTMPELAVYLAAIADAIAQPQVHLVGVSYGGFVALEFARLFPARVATMTLSGILLSHERLFDLYQDISLRFYRGGPAVFELYTHYMYEKIFGEAFVRRMGPRLEQMRLSFHDRFKDRIQTLVALTEAQNPLFAGLDEHLPGYRAIAAPTQILAGAQDRAIPPWMQERVREVIPHARYELIPDCGHVTYLEQPLVFFDRVRQLVTTRAVTP